MRRDSSTTLTSSINQNGQIYIRQRNAWIWAIISYNFLAVIGGILSLLLIHGDILPVTEQSQAVLNRITAYDNARIALNTLLLSLGTIYLYRLNKRAKWLFLLVLLISLLSVLHNVILLDAYRDLSIWQVLAKTPGYVMSLLILWYCLRLEKRGILA